MTGRAVRVLFVCTGTEPKSVNPLTLQVLSAAGIHAAWAVSKSTTGFVGQRFDYVVTVCDHARQSCPVFPGVHQSLHWGIEDPASASGTEAEPRAVFETVFGQIEANVRAFIPTAIAARRSVPA